MSTPYKCPVCDGTGQVFPDVAASTSTMKEPCNACHGTGVIWSMD